MELDRDDGNEEDEDEDENKHENHMVLSHFQALGKDQTSRTLVSGDYSLNHLKEPINAEHINVYIMYIYVLLNGRSNYHNICI